jgi:hypothetical protein
MAARRARILSEYEGTREVTIIQRENGEYQIEQVWGNMKGTVIPLSKKQAESMASWILEVRYGKSKR